jgi:hypothetical protein
MDRVALILAAAWLLAACGGGGGDGGGGPSTLDVAIDPPNATTVTTGSVDLYGIATCENCPPATTDFGRCPAINPPRASTIDVTWVNRATGASGPTSHAIVGQCSCLLSQCFVTYSHRWSAIVPVAIGPNAIEVRAAAPDGRAGQDAVTITRVPAAPTDLAAAGGKGQVTLTWSDVSGATAYDLYVATTRDVSPSSGTRIAGVSSPYAHTGLTDDITYYYTLTAVAGAFEGPPAAVAWATPGWRSEAIAAAGPTTTTTWRDVAIAADAAGHAYLHQSFGDAGPGGIFRNDYLTNAGGSWFAQPVGHPAWVSAGIALDATGTPHLGWLDTPGVSHAVLASGNWTIQVADTSAWCKSAFALDAAGRPHLAYEALAPAAVLRYASRASGAWATADVGVAGAGGCSNTGGLSLVVDAAGAAHVAWSGDYPAYGLQYATNRGGTWVVTTLDTPYITSVSLAVDAQDKAHIAYTDNAGNLKYARDAMGAWVVDVLVSSGAPGRAALAVDAGGYVYVSYVDGQYGELRYLGNASGAWRTLVIDRADADTGSTDTAIAVDAQGRVHFGYYQGGTLRYATNR